MAQVGRRQCATKARGGCDGIATEEPSCTRDGGWPPEAAVQAEASNPPLLLCLRGMVVSELGKGRARPCQVRIAESNASEPLSKCRKHGDDAKTEGLSLTRDEFGSDLLTDRMASGTKVARTRSRLLCGTWEPVAPMPRENRKWRPHERESTDAEHRGGATRSSDEGSVMELERRGRPMQSGKSEQPATGGL